MPDQLEQAQEVLRCVRALISTPVLAVRADAPLKGAVTLGGKLQRAHPGGPLIGIGDRADALHMLVRPDETLTRAPPMAHRAQTVGQHR